MRLIPFDTFLYKWDLCPMDHVQVVVSLYVSTLAHNLANQILAKDLFLIVIQYQQGILYNESCIDDLVKVKKFKVLL